MNSTARRWGISEALAQTIQTTPCLACPVCGKGGFTLKYLQQHRCQKLGRSFMGARRYFDHLPSGKINEAIAALPASPNSKPLPMDPVTLTPCPHCQAEARLRSETPPRTGFFVGCSNELDCHVWPVTPSKPTEAEAIAAWEAGETR